MVQITMNESVSPRGLTRTSRYRSLGPGCHVMLLPFPPLDVAKLILETTYLLLCVTNKWIDWLVGLKG